MTKRFCSAMVLFILVFALNACSDGSKKLTGAWKSDTNSTVIYIDAERKILKNTALSGYTIKIKKEDGKFLIFGTAENLIKYVPLYRVTFLDKDQAIFEESDWFDREKDTYVRTTVEEVKRIWGIADK